MSTVVLIVILIVLLILACTFGLIKKSKNKDRRDPFADVVTTLATDPNLMNVAASLPNYAHPAYPEYNTPVGQNIYPGSPNVTSNVATSGDVASMYAHQQLRTESTIHPYSAAGYPLGQPGVALPPGHPYSGNPYGPYPPGDPRWMAIPPGMDRSIMGSAEAEFQNDFIEVFPMRHLEPKPDLT